MNKPTFKELYYLCIQKLTNFPYIEQDFDALTNYELLCKIVEYLNKVISNENTQNESIIALYNAFTDLKNYVDNYFDNLDVQEEINNKLDEMAESGELTAIISQYLELSMFINSNVNTYYDELSQTRYYITEIPYSENEIQNKWKLGTPYDDTTLTRAESTLDFAFSKKASICINGGIGNRNTNKPHGVLIQNGVILQDESYTAIDCEILGIKENGDFVTFEADSTTAQQVLNAGCINALVGFRSIIKDGASLQYNLSNANTKDPRQVICRKTNGDYLIFTCDGRLPDNVGMTIFDVQRILQAYGNIDFAYNLDGGGSTSTIVDLQKININIDNHYQDREVLTFLYMIKEPVLDNPDMENIYKIVSNLRQSTNEKIVSGDVLSGKVSIYSEVNNPHIDFYDTNDHISPSGYLRLNYQGLTVENKFSNEDELTPLLSATENFLRYKGNAFGQFFNYAANNGNYNYNLNDLTNAGFYYAVGNTTINTPDSGNYIILHMPHFENSNVITQIAFPIADNHHYCYVRRTTGNPPVWGDWYAMGFIAGTSPNKPTQGLKNGVMYFDTTLHKPLWFQSGEWYDANGNIVS